MSYFDGLTEASFKKNTQGETLFYPWGALGKGYIVQDTKKEADLRKFTKLNYMITLPLVIVNQVLFGYLPNLILMPIYLITFFVVLKKLTKDLTTTDEKLKISESYKNSARKHNLATLIILGITALLFTITGLLFIIEGRNAVLGSFAFILFGFTTVVISYMLWIKIKTK
jgi:hypothetical protein